MTEIEWVDAAGRPLAAPPPDVPRPGRRSRTVDLRSPATWLDLGWLVIAVLAVVAPFLQVYRLKIERTPAQEVDGWGRFDEALNLAEGGGAHGLRFGIVTCVAAGLVVVSLVLRRARPDRLAGISLALRALAAGLLAATSAAMFLDMDALLDSLRSQLDRFESVSVTSTLHVGTGAWMLLADAAAGLVTLALEAGWQLRSRPTVRPAEVPPRPLGPGEEAL